MWTYFIQGVPLSPVKIGRAIDVPSRLKQLQTGTPHELRTLLVLNGDREMEMHDRFSRHRIRGEWFHWCDEIRNFINENLDARPGVWSAVNAYCTEAERQDFNEWHSRATAAAIEFRDWVRNVAMVTGQDIPREANELVDAIGSVPWIST
jgi:Meiotically up-regulated gene 113